MPVFKEYGLAELRAATKGFSPETIVSESGEKAPNVVYRGKLEGGRLVAVKRFSKQSWADAQQFVVGSLLLSFRFDAWCLIRSGEVWLLMGLMLDATIVGGGGGRGEVAA